MTLRRASAALALLLVAASPVPAQPAAAPKPVEWKLSTAVGPAFALGRAGERWARLIEERSGARIVVATHPGATLAQRDPARELHALRDGAAELAVGSTLAWSGQAPALAAVGLPWLAPTPAKLAALVDGDVRDRLVAALDRAGVVALAFAPLGHRALATTTRGVRAPADLAGMRLRFPALPPLVDLFAALGVQASAQPFAAAQAALKAGTLDGQEGTAATFAATRLDAAGVKHAIVWGAVAEVAVFAVNRATWDGLGDADRAIVGDAARDAARELGAAARRENDAALDELRRHGIAVTVITPAGHEAFAAAARAVYDRWAAVAGEELVRAAEAAARTAP